MALGFRSNDEFQERKNRYQLKLNSQIIGRVKIGKNTKIINSTIRGPVIIGENCYVENCFIGPYSSIADNVKLTDTDLEHSVILESAQVLGKRVCSILFN